MDCIHDPPVTRRRPAFHIHPVSPTIGAQGLFTPQAPETACNSPESMWRSRATKLLIGLLATVAWLPGPSAALPQTSCGVDTVGIGPEWATDQAGLALGDALGQVFSVKEDTLISAITVWRWAGQDSNLAGWHLWLAKADSTGRPIPGSVLLDGPTLPGRYGDGVTPTPFRFEFDPSFVLPGPGNYEFAINDSPCYGTIRMLANTNNAYPGGGAWLHGRSLYCLLRDYPGELPNVDLIFQIEFCQTTTPARPETWGRVKATYR